MSSADASVFSEPKPEATADLELRMIIIPNKPDADVKAMTPPEKLRCAQRAFLTLASILADRLGLSPDELIGMSSAGVGEWKRAQIPAATPPASPAKPTT